MKIKKAAVNNRKKVFVLVTNKGNFDFPFSRLRLKPTEAHPIKDAFVVELATVLSRKTSYMPHVCGGAPKNTRVDQTQSSPLVRPLAKGR
jgi:hypothetical protein